MSTKWNAIHLLREVKIAIEYGDEDFSREYTIQLVRRARLDAKNQQARAIRQAYSDCGMKRVRGALGGVYYE